MAALGPHGARCMGSPRSRLEEFALFLGQDQKEDGGGLPPHCGVDSRGQNPGLLPMRPASLQIYERISVILHSEAMVNFDATLKLSGE